MGKAIFRGPVAPKPWDRFLKNWHMSAMGPDKQILESVRSKEACLCLRMREVVAVKFYFYRAMDVSLVQSAVLLS